MGQVLTNLLKVASIVTLILTGVFAYLSVMGIVDAQQYMTIYSVIIAFYFGTQQGKKAATTTETKEESEMEVK